MCSVPFPYVKGGMVTVVALQEFRYGDRLLHIGEGVEMEPIEASVHAFAHRVSLLARPSYLTRDMVSVQPASVVVVSAQDPSPVTRRRRGRPRKTA